MKKIVIGIVATSNYMLTNDSFADHYRFGNNYIKKIVENGAIPYLIPVCNDEIIEGTLDNVDGVIFPGGERVTKFSLDIMDYCYKHKIPVLGICLGMQTMAMYSVNMEKDKRIIKKKDGHWPVQVLRDNNDIVVHKDYIEKDSKWYKIIQEEEIMVNSIHHCVVDEVGSKFRVSIKSFDDEIEGIEYIDDDRWMMGIQFHPEVLPQFSYIFKNFINICKKGE